jgi:hypothetical protein
MRVDIESGRLLLGTAGALADVEIVVLGNAIGAEETAPIGRLGGLLEDGTVSLADELGSFRVPGFFGLELVPIEIARGPSPATFFFEAVPVPEPGTEVLGAAALLGLAGLLRSRRSAPSADPSMSEAGVRLRGRGLRPGS